MFEHVVRMCCKGNVDCTSITDRLTDTECLCVIPHAQVGEELCNYLQRVSVQNCLKLPEQVQGMLCGADLLKGNVDEGLQGQLQIMNVDVELKKVPVILSSIEVQQIIRLPLDVIHNVVEVFYHLVQPIQVGVLGQRGELVDGIKHADQLLAPLSEEVKLVEDL